MKNPSMKKLYALAGEHIRDTAIMEKLSLENAKEYQRIIHEFLQYVWVNQTDNKYYKEDR